MRYCPLCREPLSPRRLGGRDRLACATPGCGFVFWNNPASVVAAIVEHEGKIVLARGVGWPEGHFGLITGFLEQDETPEQGVLREVHEELSLRAEIVSYVGHYPFPRANQLILAFHVRAEGTIVIDREELAEIRLIPPERLRPWQHGTGPAVRDWLLRQGYALPPPV